jgi:putative endonuclease
LEKSLGNYYVYILTNKSRTLYTGGTNELERRVYQHKHKLVPGFTLKYNINRLVFFEMTLIESVNPSWRDSSADWNSQSDAEILRPSASE